MSRKTIFTLNGWIGSGFVHAMVHKLDKLQKCRTFCRLCSLICLSFSLFAPKLTQAGPQLEDPAVLSSYPSFVREFSSYLKPWSVSTQTSKECRSYLDSIRASNAKVLPFDRLDPNACRLDLNLGYVNRVKGQIFFSYDISDSKRFIRFTERLNSRAQIRGLAALHMGERRPLAIFRMGVHGNRDEVLAERFLLKILHEDLRMHVIMLENLTSHSYLKMNEEVSFGGIEEGLHSFLVLKRIQAGQFLNTESSTVDQASMVRSPLVWSELVSSFHLVGLSLGGHGTFVTTWLDEQSGSTLQSTLLFCPLVNLEENFQNLAQPGFFNTFVDLWNWRRLMAIRDRVPDYSAWDFLRTLLTFTPHFTPAIVRWLDQTQPQPILGLNDIKKEFSDLSVDPKFKEHVYKSKSLLQLNQFWSNFENKKIPLSIVTTNQDPLVDPGFNSDRIMNGTQPGHFEKVQRVHLNGFHCALTAEYEWDYLVELTRLGLGL